MTVVAFRRHNLHVLNYSAPVHAKLLLAALKEHVFTLPAQPRLTPIGPHIMPRTGGSAAHEQFAALPDGIYEVLIDASLGDGSLTHGEKLHQGETDDEVRCQPISATPPLPTTNAGG